MVTSHLGRPTEGEFKPEDSLAPVAARLAELLGRPVRLVQDWVDGGFEVKPGEVVMLENCRLNKGEKKCDDALSQKLAKLCDVWAHDAFGTSHRAEATTYGMGKYAPVACAGPLLAAELDAIGKALNAPAKPLVAIVAGSKVSTKLTILEALSDKVGPAHRRRRHRNTFLLAAGKKIASPCGSRPGGCGEEGHGQGGCAAAHRRGVRHGIFAAAAATVKSIDDVADGDMILDIGPESAAELATLLKQAGTIVWNGPGGVFEFDQFGHGTDRGRAIAASPAFSLAGGGDTLAAIAKYGIADQVTTSPRRGAFLSSWKAGSCRRWTSSSSAPTTNR